MTAWYVFFAILFAIFFIAREFLRTAAPYMLAQACVTRRNFPLAARLFEIALRKKWLLGALIQDDVRYRLAWVYLALGKPEEGVRHLRDSLKNHKSPATESIVRRRLADCLEAAGRIQEATQERELASERLDSAPVDANQLASK